MCEIMNGCSAVEDIKEIRQAITKIQDALVGNEYHQVGALDRITDLEAKIEAITTKLDRLKYIAFGYAMGGTGIGIAISKIINSIL